MMPIFFHVESHLWIAYLFFFNGLLLNWLLRNISRNYYELTRPLEAQVLSAFLISISINGLVLLGLDISGVEFSAAKTILLSLTVGLLVCAFLTIRRVQVYSVECNLYRIGLYLLVFVILFYNGGLIEGVADSWWHMSYANKIAYHSSYNLEVGHLDGISKRFYPPLWHGNLALITTLSDIHLPVIWNSFTAWGAALKVMAYYLFAFALTGDKRVGLLSAVLFVVLPGVHNSYLRVSAWPSHISYIEFFAVLYVVFRLIDVVPERRSSLTESIRRLFLENIAYFCVLLWLMVLIAFTHLIELVWLFIGLMSYCVAFWFVRIWKRPSSKTNIPNTWVIDFAGVAGLSLVIISSIKLIYSTALAGNSGVDVMIALCIPILFCFAFLLVVRFASKQKFVLLSKSVTLAMVVLLVLAIDYTQLISLINSEFDMRIQPANEQFFMTMGWFGGQLELPSWNFQLRQGLLYSGILSVPIAMYLVFSHRNRATVFLAACSFTGLFFCISPYFYHWLTLLLDYGSTWRVTLLIFHPIIFAYAVRLLVGNHWKTKS
jgi:hypothetical protein